MVSGPGPDADTVIGWLSDDPLSPARPQLIESERWSSRVGGGFSLRHSRFATVPAELVHRLASSGGTWSPSSKRDEEDSFGGAFCDLVAAVEWDKWTQTRAWVFTSSPSSSLPHYGLTSEPQQVDLVPLAEGLGMGAQSRQRLLLEVRCSEDAATLARFLLGCHERGCLQVDDLAKWGRLYVVGAASLLPQEFQSLRSSTDSGTSEAGSSLRESPWRNHIVPTAWVLTHSVARLLCRAGLEGPATITMGSLKANGVGLGARLPVTAALCWVGARAVVADLAARRVIEVAPTIADILGDQCRAIE
jgi:hypothetical protein